MASTIKTLTLECEAISLPVALRGASEKKDVKFDRAAPVVVPGKKKADPPTIVPTRISRIDIPDPGPDATSVTVEQLTRNKDGKIAQQQFEGEELKGVWDGDEFHQVALSEIDQIDALTTFDTLTIEEFIPATDVPWERAQASYYLAPSSKVGSNVLRMLVTLREAMEAEGVVGVAKLMPKSRQKLAIVYPKHGGLMVTCLAYADTFQQVLDGAASMDGVEVNDEMLGWTRKLIVAKKRGPEALDEYRDDAIDLRSDLIERAKLGKPLTVEDAEVPEKEKVPVTAGSDALMEALRASVKHAQAQKRKPTAKKASRGTSGRKPATKA